MRTGKLDRYQTFLHAEDPVPMDAAWNLRFRDPLLERGYQMYAIARDSLLSRLYVTFALLMVVATFSFKVMHLPEDMPPDLLLARIIEFAMFWAVWMALLHQRRLFRFRSWVVLAGTMVGTCVLYYGQWQFWHYGSMQSALVIVMVAPMLGCVPWRVGAFAAIWGAGVLIVPEFEHQQSIALRNLHITYIITGMTIGILVAYGHERFARQQFLISERYRRQSRTDQLTGIPNRRDLDEVLPALLRQAARERSAVALAMVDVDHFKAFNDRYGHGEGDRALCAVARALQDGGTGARPDYVARYGGEEFLVAWFHPVHDAQALGDGLRQAVTAARIEHELSEFHTVTASTGVVFLYPTAQTTARELIMRADLLLYDAKRDGRNRTCVEEDRAPVDALPRTTVSHTPAPLWIDREAELAELARQTTMHRTLDRDGRRRWLSLRGLMEAQQVSWIAAVALLLEFIQTVVTWASFPREEVEMFVGVMGFIIVPMVVIGNGLIRLHWIQRHAEYIIWMFFLLPIVLVSFAYGEAMSHGYVIPYEFIIVKIFMNYSIGAQSWRTASLCGWVGTLFFAGTLYNIGGWPVVETVLIPLIVVNAIGMMGAYAQDQQSLDIFFTKERLGKLASSDALTGLSNRLGLENYANRLLPMLPARGYPLTVAMVDVDEFKRYNDHYGHEAGDHVLAAVGRTLGAQGRRAYDLAVRIGGEEFALVWYQANPEEAAELGERLRAAVHELALPHEASRHGRVTVSVGLTTGALPAGGGMSGMETMLKRADRALYAAKAAGRDCVMFAAEDGTLSPLPVQENGAVHQQA